MKTALILFILAFASKVFAQTLVVDTVKVECSDSQACKDRKIKFTGLAGEYRSLVHLKDTIRLMATDGGYRSFSYELDEVDGKNNLVVRFRLKPIIQDISVGFVDRNLQSDPNQLVGIREGDYYEEDKLKLSVQDIPKKLEAFGYPFSTYEYQMVEKEDKVDINIAITLNDPIIFKGVSSDAKSEFVKDFLVNKFTKFYDTPFEVNKYKLFLDEAQRELFSYGYYLINLEFTPVIKRERVLLKIKVNNDSLFAFDFVNLQKDQHFTMLGILSDLLRKFKRPLSDSTIKQAINEHYAKMARLNVATKIETSKFKNKFNEEATLYRITFDEKYKTRLARVNFQGNLFFTTDKLKKMFEKQAFELASIKYYDEEYFDYFTGYLKNQYIARGYVSARISGPIKNFDSDKQTSEVTYNITEGQRAFTRAIVFDGLPPEFEEEVLRSFRTKVGAYFNPIKFAEDVKFVSSFLQSRGYYFAEVTNATEDNIVTYSKSGADVEILIKVNAGQVIRLNRIIILGNSKTRKRVILKKANLEKGDLLTPTRTKEIETVLSATGLFTTVSVTPVKHNSKNLYSDLVIKLAERDYGLIEIAPGYRTDLGLKLTGTTSYTNIGGANRSVTVTGQVNRRISYAFFDDRRKKEKKKVLEYLLTTNFTQGDLFDTRVDYTLGVTAQKKMFYSFDADILRLNNTFSRDLTKRLSGSFRHQFEDISQYDASNERDHARFQIGAITPSLTYDYRNSTTLPLKGAFFNVSCEFANPYFLSQKTQDLEVNYYKLISRNRFYIPIKNGTIAISFTSGIQQNLARDVVRGSDGRPQVVTDQVDTNGNGKYDDPTDSTLSYNRTTGYIPNIKVLRLTGMDMVRGFTDEEINKLPNKYDITQVRVQNAAFLTGLKIEPRYLINDSLMAGVFYDAGRVQVNQMDFGELRSAVGITFKVVTPVGTLDFDYGIKLLRKRNLDGSLESPGRFNVSIGFF